MNRAAIMGTEASYGVAATPSTYLSVVGESLKRKPTFRAFRPERRHTNMRQVEARRSVSGNLDLYLDYDQLGLILRRLIGTPASTTGAGLGWHHTFTPDPFFNPESLTIDIARDVEMQRYTGIVFTSARLSMTTGDRHFGLSLACIGKDEAPAGAIPSVSPTVFPVPAFIGETDNPIFSPLSVFLDDGTTHWEAFAQSLNLTITWDRKLREPERRTTPTGVIGGGIIQATGKIGTLYGTDSDFLLDCIRARTPVSLGFFMWGQLVGLGDYERFQVSYPIAMVNGDPPTLKGSGRGNIDFSIDLAALSVPFSIILVNNTASYA